MKVPHPAEWTPQQNAALYRWVGLGFDDPEIAIRMGKTTGAVRQRRIRMQIPRPIHGGYVWNEEQDACLGDLWAGGMATVHIALALAEKFDRPFTKNSVIGRARRLGLASRKLPPKLGEKGFRAKRVRARRAPPLQFETRVPPPPAEDHPWQLFGELGYGTCRFVQGDPRGLESLMCGLPTHAGSYCQYHYWMTHRVKRASVASRAVVLEAAPPSGPLDRERAASLSSGGEL